MRERTTEDFVPVNTNGTFARDSRYSGSFADKITGLQDSIGNASSPISTHTAGTSGASDLVISGALGSEQGDWIAVNLTAGVTYTFAQRGLEDPYLFLYDADGVYITEDDDGGYGRSAMITFTATETATHYLFASSWYHLDPSAPGYPTADQGNYTIDIWQANPANDVAATRADALAIGLGTTFGYLEAANDLDMYKVELTAGMVYNFTYAGGIGGASDWEDPTTAGESLGILRLYDASGNPLAAAVALGDTGISFFAAQGGTYYIRAEGYETTMTGGYTLDVEEIDPASRNPLESLNWDSADNIDTIDENGDAPGGEVAYVYFGAPGENFGEPGVNMGWQPHQIAAVMSALGEYTPITGIEYRITTDVNQAEFRMMTVATASYGARFYPQDPAYGTQQGIGTFNLASGGFGQFPQSLERGGYSYAVILHEFGHAHGIAHPHDTGGGSEVMLGVAAAQGSYGVYNLNQGVYTVMSYNDAWTLHPDGPSSFTIAGIDNGWSATLGAFDIAVLQARYGVHAHNTGNNVYALTDQVNDAFYQTIWDTGGIDEISYGGALNAQIDLTAATLDYTPTGGGVISFLYNDPATAPASAEIKGGYTIANGVVIENATGGSGNDVLIGNAAANVLTGNAGNDTLMGRAGNDILNGGAGNDTLIGGDGVDRMTGGEGDDVFVGEINATKTASKSGPISLDIITDFGAGDKIDLRGLDANANVEGHQAFNFKGSSANKSAGDLTYKTYTSINGAEKALGIDIDGVDGPGAAGPVTVVFGNVDGGAADFMIVLLNKNGVSASDFLMTSSSASLQGARVGSEIGSMESASTFDGYSSKFAMDYLI